MDNNVWVPTLYMPIRQTTRRHACGYLSGLFGFLLVRNRAQITGLKATKIINKWIINVDIDLLRLTLMVNAINKLNIWRGKVHSTTSYEGREREYSYSSTISLTSALQASRWSTPRPSRFTLGRGAPYLTYRRLGAHQGPAGRILKRENLLPLPECES